MAQSESEAFHDVAIEENGLGFAIEMSSVLASIDRNGFHDQRMLAQAIDGVSPIITSTIGFVVGRDLVSTRFALGHVADSVEGRVE